MSEFLLQSPPGQINDVYNDLIALTTVDASLFKTHNLEQLIPYKITGSEDVIIPGLDATWEGNLLKFKNSTYALDHVKLEATVKKEGKEDADPVRKALEDQVAEYVQNYYPGGNSTVHKTAAGYTIYIVGNQYNPSNFWAGRWRGVWKVANNALNGSVTIQIHYYEDGNVQLNASKEFTASDLPKDAQELATVVVKNIQKSDVLFQTAINNSFADSGVATFKNLRRALPITRSKIEWASILSYKVGDELGPK